MKNRQRQKDILFSILIFGSAFAVNLLIQKLFTTQTLVPMIFVFGVFLISLITHGYCYGITSAIVSVFAVDFVFTYQYYVFGFFVEESILSAVIMMVVAVSTSTLNIRIRDQEKLRSENEKERMRGNLLRAISHDLRTPLTSIYGSSSTLLSKYDELPKEQQLKLLGEIQEDSEWLIRMVENLLSVTRIDGAKVKVVKTPTVLDELIDSVLMKFSKKHPNQKVITQIPDEFVDIPMDSLLIEQVLLNLLENAVFHAKGMTELILSVSLAGDKAVFEVADNGCGIPEDALQKIFSGSYAAIWGSDYLCALPSSRRTAVTLPQKTGRAAVRYSALRWKEGVRTMGNNKYKILIVEDEANIRSFIKANLETSDYQVLCAETCALGIMMYASHRPDLIVLDLGLPDRDGLDLIQKVRESDTVPIIVLSARSNERDKVEALDLGANDYITTPFGTEELLARIRAVLRSHRHSKEEERSPGGKFRLQDLLIDYDTRQVFVGKEEIDLTQTEYNIMAFLSVHAGKVLTYAAIIRAVWGYSDYGSVKKLQVNMMNILKKMGVTPGEKRYIINELGGGYRMLAEDEA